MDLTHDFCTTFALFSKSCVRWQCYVFFRLRVPEEALIPLTKTDESKLSSLLRRPYLTHQPNWKKEVSEGKGGVKCEIAGMRYELSWNHILGQFYFHIPLILVVIKHSVHVNPFYITRNKCDVIGSGCVL